MSKLYEIYKNIIREMENNPDFKRSPRGTIQINSFTDAQKYNFNVVYDKYDSGDYSFHGDNYYLQDVGSGEIYLKGNIHWLNKNIENQKLNINNPDELVKFLRKR